MGQQQSVRWGEGAARNDQGQGWKVPGDLSQFSHGLTGRYGTMASVPDTQQDADLRFWIAEHWPDTLH
jgi:hypothetical protein